MDKDDVIRWARESGMSIHGNMETDATMAFAALAYAAGQEDGRELAERIVDDVDTHLCDDEQREWIKSAIRARGNGG